MGEHRCMAHRFLAFDMEGAKDVEAWSEFLIFAANGF